MPKFNILNSGITREKGLQKKRQRKHTSLKPTSQKTCFDLIKTSSATFPAFEKNLTPWFALLHSGG